jgi:hypothetical protein
MSKVRPKKWSNLKHVEKHAFLLVGRKRQQAAFGYLKICTKNTVCGFERFKLNLNI